MPPLAVDQHQGLIRREPAQRRRADVGVAVRCGRVREVERGQQRLQDLADIGVAAAAEVLRAQHIDRHRRFEHGAGLGAVAEDGELVELGDRRRTGRGLSMDRNGGEQTGKHGDGQTATSQHGGARIHDNSEEIGHHARRRRWNSAGGTSAATSPWQIRSRQDTSPGDPAGHVANLLQSVNRCRHVHSRRIAQVGNERRASH
ncbi:hypothetical protein D3C71_898460 [compost metagenome]